MISVRALIGASIAIAFSVASANAIPVLPGSTTAITAPNTYTSQVDLNPFTAVNDNYTFTFTPVLSALTTSIVLDSNGGGTGYGIANLFYEWVGIKAPVQVSDAAGNFTGSIPTTLTGLLTSSPLVLHVFTNAQGGSLGLGGGYQIRLSVSETPVPGALALFGSVLAGGIGGVQLMRRRRMAVA